MIFFKNLFFLLLSVALFAQGGTTTSQNITSTDSPSELIDGKLATYKSPKTQNFHDAEGLMHSTIESIYSTIPIPTSQPKPIYRTKKEIEQIFNEAVVQAKNEHKIILLEIYGTDCHFCEKIEREVFPKERVMKELKDNFIVLKINGDEEYIPLNIEKQMTPMHVFITEKKDIKDMTFGISNEKEFLELLEREKK